MIILDTNVLSPLMRPEPDGAIRTWLDGQRAEDVHTTAISVFELLTGIEMWPAGQKRRSLERSFAAMMMELEGRTLPFDDAAAAAAAPLVARRRREGRPVEFRDTQIAGIVLSNKSAACDLQLAPLRRSRHRAGRAPELARQEPIECAASATVGASAIHTRRPRRHGRGWRAGRR